MSGHSRPIILSRGVAPSSVGFKLQRSQRVESVVSMVFAGHTSSSSSQLRMYLGLKKKKKKKDLVV